MYESDEDYTFVNHPEDDNYEEYENNEEFENEEE